MDIYEEEFEYVNKNNNKNLSGSIKNNQEESDNKKNNFIYNVNNNNNDNNNNNSNNSLPKISISPVHDHYKINCKNVFDFTDQLYSNDEHFNKLMFDKKMLSQNNIINCKKFLSVNNIYQNFDKNSSTSKFDINGKSQKKSLFHGVRNKLEEEKRTINLSINRSNRQSVCSPRKKYLSKNNKYAAFLKLQMKAKRPSKVSYIDNIINKSNNLKIDNSLNKKENKEQENKSINKSKNSNKNIIFTQKIIDEIDKKEGEEELIRVKTKNNSASKIEENKNQYQSKKYIGITKDEKNFQSKKCLPFQLLCCLNFKLH